MSLAITHYDISDFNLENSYVTQLEGFEGLENTIKDITPRYWLPTNTSLSLSTVLQNVYELFIDVWLILLGNSWLNLVSQQ